MQIDNSYLCKFFRCKEANKFDFAHLAYRKGSFFFVLILSMLAVLSCVNRNGKAVQSHDLLGRSVTFTSELKPTFNGRDTNLVIEEGIKMMIFYDSIDCTSCLMNQMYEWSDIINYCEENDVRLYFILSPSAYEFYTLINLLRIQSLDYPVWVDPSGSFLAANHFMLKGEKNSYLLDADNRIILVGIPLRNSALWEEYKRLMITKN